MPETNTVLLRRQLLGGQQALHRGEDRVVAAAGTPAGPRALVVAHLVVVRRPRPARARAAGRRRRVMLAPPRGMRPRMASRIAPGRSGSPGTRVQQSTSTSVARAQQEGAAGRGAGSPR